MPTAEEAFSSLCPDLSFPSPAINAYGTLAGLSIASLFNLLIVLFQPASSAIYICAQLMLGNMYVVAIMVRNWMGTVSNGTNAIQKWHAEFAFLLASSTSSLILACLLSDVHHIHGFGRKEDLHEFQIHKSVQRSRKRPTIASSRLVDGGSHTLFRRVTDSKPQRLRKFFARRQALILFITFVATQVFWFIVYGATIWWAENTKFWQSNCDDHIGSANFAMLRGVSWVFASIALLSSLLLAIPVWTSVSASEFITRLFHLHGSHPLRDNSQLRLRLKVQNYVKRGNVGFPHNFIHVETKTEKRVKIVLSLTLWSFWFISMFVIFFRALDNFLLVGTAWPYAGIQNFLFGCLPLVKFLISPLREHFRERRKRRRMAQTTTPSASRATAPKLPSLRLSSATLSFPQFDFDSSHSARVTSTIPTSEEEEQSTASRRSRNRRMSTSQRFVPQ
ncbi:hypothetical protein JCM5350_003142 [Sporobolomyces pararoseus]